MEPPKGTTSDLACRLEEVVPPEVGEGLLRFQILDTGGKGAFTQWVYCEFIVGFETIRPANTHQANSGFF